MLVNVAMTSARLKTPPYGRRVTRSVVAMNLFAKPLLASAALCAATLLPARAEIDVARLKSAFANCGRAVAHVQGSNVP